MNMNDFKNMMKVFGVIASTEVIEIERGKFDEEQLYLDNIIFNKVPFSSNCPEKINFPEWIKLNVLNILEDILGDNFCYKEVRKLVYWSWEMKKIKPGKGRYEKFGLGYSMLLNTITDKKDQINIEILNAQGSVRYYKFTFRYKNKKKIYYVPATEVYNKDFKEVFPII